MVLDIGHRGQGESAESEVGESQPSTKTGNYCVLVIASLRAILTAESPVSVLLVLVYVVF
jgi:hypothetical protein